MGRRQARDPAARRLVASKRERVRYADLCVEFVDERDQSVILRVGGRWDRKLKDWTDDDPKTSLQIRVHAGQVESVQWFRSWLEAYFSGEPLEPAIYSALLLGGSRAGKTYVGVALMVAFTVAVPGARVWAVQEADRERVDELEAELDQLLPHAWFSKSGGRYTCAHGATIKIRSGKYPAKLKRGRCDFGFVNEGQNVKRAAFDMMRMRTSDTGGIVLVAANPPNNNPDGQWIADWSDEQDAGHRPNSVAFAYHYSDNPHVKREQLAAIQAETDQRTWEIEVEGKVLPPSNAVLHAFKVGKNVDSWPELPGLDVTAEFAKRRGLGGDATAFVGLDFQRAPHMAAIIQRAVINPEDVTRPFLYAVDEVLVELGDEHDLSTGLYAAGLDPLTTVLIGDASGDWQDADRTKGGSSFETLRACGWKRIHKPESKSDKNPLVSERMKNDNRLLAAADGTHISRIDPKCRKLIEACKQYRVRHGIPDRGSEFAHIWDAWSYGNWRLYPRRLVSRRIRYKRLTGRTRPAQMRRF